MNQIERAEVTVGLLEELLPLECEIVGPEAVADAAAGTHFAQAAGGRHQDLSQVFTYISCATGIIQCVLAYLYRPKSEPLPNTQITFDELAALVAELSQNDKGVSALLTEKQELLARLAVLLKHRGLLTT